MAGQVADGRPRMEYTHQQAARRGSPFCSLASAQLGTIFLWLRLSRQQRAAASIPLGSSHPPPPSFSMPQEPCALCPGSWVPMSLPLPGPHTLPENPSLADPSGLHASTYK